jgi:hypothetical protein
MLSGKHKDILKTELSFLRTTDEQRDIQRLLARHTMSLWRVAIEYETKRTENMHRALVLYTEAFFKCYGRWDPAVEEI